MIGNKWIGGILFGHAQFKVTWLKFGLSRGREEQAGLGRGFFTLAAQPSPAQRSSRLNRLVCHAITTTITYHLLVAHPSNMRASQVQFSGMPTGKTYVSIS